MKLRENFSKNVDDFSQILINSDFFGKFWHIFWKFWQNFENMWEKFAERKKFHQILLLKTKEYPNIGGSPRPPPVLGSPVRTPDNSKIKNDVNDNLFEFS